MFNTICGEIEQFCYSVLDRLNTTKATIELCERDIIKNCNTSMFNTCEYIAKQLSLVTMGVIDDGILSNHANTLIVNVKEKLLAPYCTHFSSWSEYNVAKAGKENPDFYNDLLCIQKLEKDYPFYDKMYVAFKECQELFIEFKNRLELYLKTNHEEDEG